ncbi:MULTISPECIES: hypothetical protein [unclassified Erwinia]|nr:MULTISPECIES: hypothetical protein [unclassified Erwinia]
MRIEPFSVNTFFADFSRLTAVCMGNEQPGDKSNDLTLSVT